MGSIFSVWVSSTILAAKKEVRGLEKSTLKPEKIGCTHFLFYRHLDFSYQPGVAKYYGGNTVVVAYFCR